MPLDQAAEVRWAQLLLLTLGVQRPHGGLVNGPPRCLPPREHLADPRPQVVTPVKEGRPPSVLVAVQPEVECVTLHPRRQRAHAGPRVLEDGRANGRSHHSECLRTVTEPIALVLVFPATASTLRLNCPPSG